MNIQEYELKVFAKVVCIAIVIRFITQMTSFFIPNNANYGIIVYNGILIFEIVSLLIMLRLFNHIDYCKYFIDFSIGCSVYALIKTNLLDAYKVSFWEYLSTIIGLIYIAIKYVFIRSFKRVN